MLLTPDDEVSPEAGKSGRSEGLEPPFEELLRRARPWFPGGSPSGPRGWAIRSESSHSGRFLEERGPRPKAGRGASSITSRGGGAVVGTRPSVSSSGEPP